MILTLTIIFFLFGLIIGSFLNVVICRYNTAKNLGGRSCCMSCETTLLPYELVPLFSFLALGGRCRTCKTKISIQYPIVEFVVGLIFAGLFLNLQNIFFANTLVFAATFAYYGAMFSLLVVIATYDFKHKIIPDKLALIFGGMAFFGMFFFDGSAYIVHFPYAWQIFAGIIISAPFALIWLFSRGRWMGLGDAKLAIGLGWLLGLPMALSGVVVAFWSGAVIGIILILFSKKHGMRSEIPFAPFLVLGTIIAFLFQLQIFPLPF